MEPFFVKQADYIRSPSAEETAKNIIKAKIANCEFLIVKYSASARRWRDDRMSRLTHIQKKLSGFKESANNITGQQKLLLHEARAAEVYYSGLAIVTKEPLWRRNRRGKIDMLNLLLNIGYHLLSLECEKALITAGLNLEGGVLHGGSSGKPLLYDFMEIFRQPVVDRIILPLFSRKSVSELTEHDKARFLKRFSESLNKPFWYKNRCETMRRIFMLEAYEFKRAVIENRPFVPYHHRSGNSSPCNKKAPPIGSA